MSILIELSSTLFIYQQDVAFTAIRSQGPGGQHVNKTSSAILLQFNIQGSALPERIKDKIYNYSDYRISSTGFISIKAQRFRSQEQNRNDAIERLESLLKKILSKKKYRVPTKRTKGSVERRIKKKKNAGKIKSLRAKPTHDD